MRARNFLGGHKRGLKVRSQAATIAFNRFVTVTPIDREAIASGPGR